MAPSRHHGNIVKLTLFLVQIYLRIVCTLGSCASPQCTYVSMTILYANDLGVLCATIYIHTHKLHSIYITYNILYQIKVSSQSAYGTRETGRQETRLAQVSPFFLYSTGNFVKQQKVNFRHACVYMYVCVCYIVTLITCICLLTSQQHVFKQINVNNIFDCHFSFFSIKKYNSCTHVAV